jgi:XRE family transcriptional regulator, regulator of sulfur utilization
MSHLDKNIAINLKRIRKSRNMSLDMMAEQTGVSKSMLGQIERGESNPTVTTIGKIVEGIRVSFDELIQAPTEQVTLVEKGDMTKARDIANNCRVYIYFPYDERRNFEIYLIEIDPGGEYKTASRGENTYEYVTVSSGELTLAINDKQYAVKGNNSIKFAADQEHSYRNNGEEMLYLHVVLYWDKIGFSNINDYIGA